jgi:large subunit ribosomal protein L4e
MKATIFNKQGNEKGKVELPNNFSSEVRRDIVMKVFEAQKRRQPHEVMFGAGAWYSASGISRKKRHAWKVTYGKGISRVPRKIMSRHGASFNWVGATTAAARGGRAAHPPRVEENQFRKINKNELKIAINSSLGASANKELLAKNYGSPINFAPIIFDEEVLKIKTGEFFTLLKKLFGDSCGRLIKTRAKRSGRGKYRGRKYKTCSGLLMVIGNKESTKRKGIEVVRVEELCLANLTLNGVPGKAIAYTVSAIKEIGERWKE